MRSRGANIGPLLEINEIMLENLLDDSTFLCNLEVISLSRLSLIPKSNKQQLIVCLMQMSDHSHLVCEVIWTCTNILTRNKVKRMGVGGRLVPFFKCVCVYFVGLGADGEGGQRDEEAPPVLAVCAKCAPVLCLVLLVALHLTDLPHTQGTYARRVCLGLALSALGDALLLWPQHFAWGMAAFGTAHGAYLGAFACSPCPAAPRVAAVLYLATALFVRALSPPAELAALVPFYTALLATMAWRGVARGGAARAGALLFLLSDAALGYSLWGAPSPLARLLVMPTYYLAQLALALSALHHRHLEPNAPTLVAH